MHMSDGVLSLPVIVFGWVLTILFLAFSLRRVSRISADDAAAQIPKIAVMTAAFFVASLIEIPVGPTSVHLVLAGLLGVILGPYAFAAVFVALFMQAAFFHFGGLSSLGANALNMGLCAFFAAYLYRALSKKLDKALSAGLSAALSVLLGASIVFVFLMVSSGTFLHYAKLELIAHAVLAVAEGVITAAAVTFILKVKPSLLPADDGEREYL